MMRIKNEKIILSLINKSPVSRADIAKRTGLTKAAVTIIVDDLKERGIVCEQSGRSNTVGRNPVMLHLNEQAYYTVGINITRRHITLGITDLGGNTVKQLQLPVCSPSEAFPRIKRELDGMISSSDIDSLKIYKLAVVTPGPVDAANGVILNPPNFKEWHNVEIAHELKIATGLDVILENVSNANAIAEKYFGAARDTENFLVLRVDEGIGSGMVLDDAPFKGPCELGHTSIEYNGIECECGNRGCLEKYASIPSLLEGTGYYSWQEAVDRDDKALLEREAEYLCTSMITVNNIFRLDKIVLCGDLTYKPDRIIELLNEKTEKRMLSSNLLKICAGQVKDKLLIASSVAINDFFA